jgi:hypothetical protein
MEKCIIYLENKNKQILFLYKNEEIRRKTMNINKMIIISKIIGLVMLTGFSLLACGDTINPTVVKEEQKYGDFLYNVSNDGRSVIITKYLGNEKDVDIPSYIEVMPVTSIGESAFSSKGLISVIIPNSVTNIENFAFFDNKLANVAFSDSVTTIGDGAFSLNKIINITIPDSVIIIGDLAFAANEITNVTIPDNVTTIGHFAFSGNQLSNIIIPDNVTTIGIGVFFSNPLTNISVATNNKAYITKDFFLLSKDEELLIRYYGSEKIVNIPSNVKYIDYGAFSDCTSLESVIIPASVISIGDEAFPENTRIINR